MLPSILRATARSDPSSRPSERDVTRHAETVTGTDPFVRSDTRIRRAMPSPVTGGSPSLSLRARTFDSIATRQFRFVLNSPPMVTDAESFGNSEW